MKILIVDDELIIRKGLCKMISRFGEQYVITGEAENGKQGLGMVKTLCPDLIITDVRMPEMDGIELCASIDRLNREEMSDKKVKCIILSGYSEFSYARDAMKYGVSEYILKPVNEELLKNTLQRLEEQIAEERNMSEAIKQYYDNALPALEEKKLRDILFDWTDNRDSMLQEMENAGIELKHNAFLLISVKIDAFSPQEQLRKESIKSLVDFKRMADLNDDDLKIFCTLIANDELVMLINFHNGENGPQMDKNKVSSIKNVIVRRSCSTVSFGVSSVFFNLCEIHDQYRSAERALSQASICGGDAIYYPLEFLGERKHGSKARVVQEAAAYMAAHYTQDLTLEAVSARFYMSASYFSDLFKKEMGIKFIDYLTKVRIDKAKELLKNSKHKIFEVAGMVGYEDANYFSRAFSKEVGISPAEYRNRICQAGL